MFRLYVKKHQNPRPPHTFQSGHTQTHSLPSNAKEHPETKLSPPSVFQSVKKSHPKKKLKLARNRCKFHGAARKNGPFHCPESVLNGERQTECSKFAKVSVPARGYSFRARKAGSFWFRRGGIARFPPSFPPCWKRNPLAMAMMASWMIRHRSQRQRSN